MSSALGERRIEAHNYVEYFHRLQIFKWTNNYLCFFVVKDLTRIQFCILVINQLI